MASKNILWLYQGDCHAFSYGGIILRYDKEEAGFQVVIINNIYDILGKGVYKIVNEYKDRSGLYGQPEKVEIIPGGFLKPDKKIYSNPLVCNEFNEDKFCIVSHKSAFTTDIINDKNISSFNSACGKEYKIDMLSDEEIMEIGIFFAESGLLKEIYPELIAQKTKALEIISTIFYMDGMPKHIKDNLIY